MLDLERIQKLVDMMVAHDLVELSLRDGDVEVNLRRPHGNAQAEVLAGSAAAAVAPIGADAAPAPDPEEGGTVVEIKSPMVGTFYVAPDPDSPPYVRVGSTVQPKTFVCAVGAMKNFCEIEAGVSGVIDRILVKNEEGIECNQPLFLVRTE